ncbi:Gamma-tubulin complex component 2 [Ceratocystis fimbriata CBS 114723]|uniref:Spindle pole body component n=1 Tax=Ceratocystis fimbriata CBS 114723 TaxID=1035309 RepID=A0A2C5X8G3_9PEZI|nr:Gamma-tubulin complex component 2 [Ceratocystis fimbriata CBS 114723]
MAGSRATSRINTTVDPSDRPNSRYQSSTSQAYRGAGTSTGDRGHEHHAGDRGANSRSPSTQFFHGHGGHGSTASSMASSTAHAHKRSASANPSRSHAGRSTEDMRVEERERRTETRTSYQVETLMSRTRTRSPDRRDRRATAQKRPEPKQKDRPAPETPQVLWNPEASIVKHTTAPLASRISMPPSASHYPQPPKPLADLSLEAQEAVIIEDLLFAFMGYEGQYIRFAKVYDPSEERDRLTGPEYRVAPGLDPSLHDLTASMLRMATHYSALQCFVDAQSRDEFGLVNHALCASVRKILHEYLVMIAQLETQFLTNENFTIHVLNVHIKPMSHTLFQIYTLGLELLTKNALLDEDSEEEIDSGDDFENILETLREGAGLGPGNITGKKECKGGVVLGLITQRLETMSGDPAAKKLLTALLQDASRPYMVMLNEWLHHGSIHDPHSEFMIKAKSIRHDRLEQDYIDEYWDSRYTVQQQIVPPQLEAVKEKVLLSGKYLNVVRECGGMDVSTSMADVPTTFDDAKFLENINAAYAHANESLMQLLLTTHALPARLRSIKHYFFLDPSDYFTYFLELGASELRKPIKIVNTGKLQSLLDLVLRQPGSVVSLDPFKEDVKVEMNEVPWTRTLQHVVGITGVDKDEVLPPVSSQPLETDRNATGITSLQLDYAVPFPVSLVISRRTIWRYQTLFRYLLSLQHLEAQLSTSWQLQSRGLPWTNRSSNRRLEVWKARAWTLRSRMLVFVQQLRYFCTTEIIEPNWQKFMARLDRSDASSTMRTVDEVIGDHIDFLDSCLKECMLTNGKLLRIHSKLMQTCTFFASPSTLTWITREIEKSDPDLLPGAARPPSISTRQWSAYQATKASRPAELAQPSSSSSSTAASNQYASIDARVDNLFDLLSKWELNFSKHLQILLDALNHYAARETVVLLSLCARLSIANNGTAFSGLRHDDEAAGT